MIITFVGDICLGRYVRDKFEKSPYQLVDQDVIDKLVSKNGRVIANLESPVADGIRSEGIRFSGTSAMLSQFNWVNCFSLANNHINDFDEEGMSSTIESLKKEGFDYNGVYENEYTPYLINESENKIAIITCSYGVNRKIDSNSHYKLLNIKEDTLYTLINKYKQLGYFVIVYAHMGIMFCRFPSPKGKEIIHKMIDNGCGCLMVSHPHCVGGVYKYKSVPVFYSLGDFLMDGESFRRRQSCAVKLNVLKNQIVGWELIPTITGTDLQVRIPSHREERKTRKGIERTSVSMTKQRDDYGRFLKYQYKKDVLRHSISTIVFVVKTKGINGFLRALSLRKNDVHSMVKRVKTNRPGVRNGK